MISFKLLFLSVTLLPSLWAESGAASLEKRFSINMMDPLTRRSALDKTFVRFGRSGGGLNVNREGRGRPDSFVRFGRSDFDQDEELDDDTSLREARGKTDFIRFGRGGGSNSGFIRFGRGRNDNFVRFGRARQDNFIRFGKSGDNEGYDLHRALRSGGGPNRQNTNFVRFGKRVPENDEEIVNAYKNGLNLDLDDPGKENLARMARFSNRNKGDSFIRFGRSFDEDPTKTFAESFNALKYLTDQKPLGTSDQYFTDENQTSETDSETEIPKSTSTSSTDYNYDQPTNESRIKRSIKINPSSATDSPDMTPLYKLATPLAAGLPNFIIGPELSMLPPHQPKSRTKIDDRNFIRLG